MPARADVRPQSSLQVSFSALGVRDGSIQGLGCFVELGLWGVGFVMEIGILAEHLLSGAARLFGFGFALRAAI